MRNEVDLRDNNNKISIIIAIYQVEQYLERCIRSVINQTYYNLEIILVEDGSPDRCGSICDTYAQIDPRIKVIHKQNGGLSEARNYGMNQATGDYIGFIDGDDFIEKDMFEVLHTKAVEYQTDITICDFYTVKNNKVNLHGIATHDTVYTREEALCELAKDRITNHAWNKLYKRELFSGIAFPVGMAFEDIATTYQLFLKSSRIAYIRGAKYYYFIRDTGVTGKKVYYAADYLRARREQYLGLSMIIPHMSGVLYDITVKAAVYLYNQALMEHGIGKKDKAIILSEIRKLAKDKGYATLALREKLVVRLLSGTPALYRLLYLFFRVKAVKQLLHMLVNVYRITMETIKLTGELKRKEPVIYIIGTPEHNNLGDHAIAYAESIYIKKHFSEYQVLELPESMLRLRLLLLKKVIKKSDIIVYHGGGNIGNQYLYYEEQRRWVIGHFRNNRILLFPQTIYFTKDKAGAKQLQISCDRYQHHRDLIIAAREQYSYHIARNYFTGAQTFIVPDIVLSLNEIRGNSVREGALLCLRDDVEKSLNDEKEKLISQCVERYYSKVTYTDTCVVDHVPVNGRTKALEAKWYQFQQAELVITDRIHGMIFAALTGTPCIAFNNYNYKVEGTYRWLKHLPYIRHINHPNELEGTLLQLRRVPIGELHYDNNRLRPYFDTIKDSIRLNNFSDIAEQDGTSYGLR